MSPFTVAIFVGICLFILLIAASGAGSSQRYRKTWNLRVAKGEPFWRGLERGISRSLKKQGWKARVTPGTRDNGADVVARFGDISFAIEAKWWKAEDEIKVPEVKKIVRGMHYHNCSHAAIITTARADSASKKYARKAQVLIIERAFSIHSANLSTLLLNFASAYEQSDPPRKVAVGEGRVVEVKKTRGGQCHGKTKKGNRCRNSAKAGKRFCHFHVK